MNNYYTVYSATINRTWQIYHFKILDQKTLKHTLVHDLPPPQKNGLEEEELSQNEMFCSCISFMARFEAISIAIA